jgi:ABC-type transport system involved in cytochrome c biogenesis permease subunit
MDENPYEAPNEVPETKEGSKTSAVTGAIVLWRFSRFTFLSSVLLSAVCIVGMIPFPMRRRTSALYADIFANGLSLGVVALMISGFLLVVSHFLARRS